MRYGGKFKQCLQLDIRAFGQDMQMEFPSRLSDMPEGQKYEPNKRIHYDDWLKVFSAKPGYSSSFGGGVTSNGNKTAADQVRGMFQRVFNPVSPDKTISDEESDEDRVMRILKGRDGGNSRGGSRIKVISSTKGTKRDGFGKIGEMIEVTTGGPNGLQSQLMTTTRNAAQEKIKRDYDEKKEKERKEKKAKLCHVRFNLKTLTYKECEYEAYGYKKPEIEKWHFEGLKFLLQISEMPPDGKPIEECLADIAAHYEDGKNIREENVMIEMTALRDAIKPGVVRTWVENGTLTQYQKENILSHAREQASSISKSSSSSGGSGSSSGPNVAFNFYKPSIDDVDAVIRECAEEIGIDLEFVGLAEKPVLASGNEADGSDGAADDGGKGDVDSNGEGMHWRIGKIWKGFR